MPDTRDWATNNTRIRKISYPPHFRPRASGGWLTYNFTLLSPYAQQRLGRTIKANDKGNSHLPLNLSTLPFAFISPGFTQRPRRNPPCFVMRLRVPKACGQRMVRNGGGPPSPGVFWFSVDRPSPFPWSQRSPPDAAASWPLRGKACSWTDCGYACQQPKGEGPCSIF